MDVLARQVRRVRRRLLLEQFLAALAWTWFAGLSLAVVAIVAGKFWSPGMAPSSWSAAWLAGGSIGGIVAAGIWTGARARSSFDAACEIDRRFNLRERVSTALALSPAELSTAAGQAVLHDAIEQSERVRVADEFAIALDRRSWLPLLPAAVAVLSTLFIPGRVVETALATETTATSQVKNSAQTLEKRLVEKRAEARDKGLQDADGLLKKVEDGMRKLGEQQKTDPKQALVELNDLAKDLERRRDKLLAEDKLKQHLSQMQEMEHGPADKFSQAVKNGDFKRAADELKKLQDQLAKGQLNEKERQQLAEQLDHMQQNLQKALTARQDARDSLQRQIADKRQAGDQKEAERLQQQLDQLDQQSRQAQQMAQMGQKLCKAGQCIKQGDPKAASEALDAIGADLKSAEQSSEELAMLDEALEQIGEAKSSMNCKECKGTGCKACQGHDANQQGPPGLGIGRGHLAGAPPKGTIKTGLYDSKVPQNAQRGPAVIVGEADGPNRKGEVQEAIKTQFEISRHEAADPLTSQRLPRDYRDHAKKYFESLREGAK